MPPKASHPRGLYFQIQRLADQTYFNKMADTLTNMATDARRSVQGELGHLAHDSSSST
ncbi:hypothetical protein JG687_00018959 [Phytophthora cactorum]|uniref:Uncharacterized protein n=1 Tax=Phytophthora cactorum TaxID=29920 RepID=A0A8T1TNE5_9STRA|nr:hypothetical protein JG687_00018959 [Phytophthora cactorum]